MRKNTNIAIPCKGAPLEKLKLSRAISFKEISL